MVFKTDYRLMQGDHSALVSSFIKLPFVFKIFVLSILSGCLRRVLMYFIGQYWFWYLAQQQPAKAYAQTLLSLCYLQTQSMDEDEGSDQHIAVYVKMGIY